MYPALLEKLFKANEELAVQATLDRHTKEGLLNALKEEKKSNKRGKWLNVLGKEHTKLILFKAEVVRQAQAIVAEKEAFEKAERARIDTNKVASTAKKELDAIKKAEKA